MKKILVIDSIYEKHFSDLCIPQHVIDIPNASGKVIIGNII